MKISRRKYLPKTQSAKKKYIGGTNIEYILKYIVTLADKSLEKDGDYLVNLLITNNIQNLIGLTDDNEIVSNYNNFFNSVKDNLVKHVFTTKKDMDEYVKTVSVDYDTSIKLLWIVFTIYIIANIDHANDNNDNNDDNDDGDADILDINLVSYNTIAKNIKKNRLTSFVIKGGSPPELDIKNSYIYARLIEICDINTTHTLSDLRKALDDIRQVIRDIPRAINTENTERIELNTQCGELIKLLILEIENMEKFEEISKSTLINLGQSVVSTKSMLFSMWFSGVIWIGKQVPLQEATACVVGYCTTPAIADAIIAGAVMLTLTGSLVFIGRNHDMQKTAEKVEEYKKKRASFTQFFETQRAEEIVIKRGFAVDIEALYTNVNGDDALLRGMIDNLESGTDLRFDHPMSYYRKQLDDILQEMNVIRSMIYTILSNDTVIFNADKIREMLDRFAVLIASQHQLYQLFQNGSPPPTPVHRPHRPIVPPRDLMSSMVRVRPGPRLRLASDVARWREEDERRLQRAEENRVRELEQLQAFHQKKMDDLVRILNLNPDQVSQLMHENNQDIEIVNGILQIRASRLREIRMLSERFSVDMQDAELALDNNNGDVSQTITFMETREKNVNRLMLHYNVDRQVALYALDVYKGHVGRAMLYLDCRIISIHQLMTEFNMNRQEASNLIDKHGGIINAALHEQRQIMRETNLNQLVSSGIPNREYALELLDAHNGNVANAILAVPAFIQRIANIQTLMEQGISDDESRNLLDLNAGNLQLALTEAQTRLTEAIARLDAANPEIDVPDEFMDHVVTMTILQDPVRLVCGNQQGEGQHIFSLSTIYGVIDRPGAPCPSCRAPIEFTTGADEVKRPNIPPIVRLTELTLRIRDWLTSQGLYRIRPFIPPPQN